jgi:PPOX class probable F420-dependent enzyme
MAARIPDEFLDLFTKRSFAHLATLMPDGTPQVTPVWIDYDGEHILVDAAKGRRKNRNMEMRPAVAISITDPDDPYRYLAVRGRVVAIEDAPDYAHIDKLAHRYTGKEHFQPQPGEVRQIFKILPEHVTFQRG